MGQIKIFKLYIVTEYKTELYLKMPGPDGTLGPKEIGVLKTLLKFTIAMLSIPIISYFFLKKYVIENIFGYENGSIQSVIFTVVIIHMIIGMYIWTAIKEEGEEKRTLKAD